jgi:hypothetical protein
MCTYYLAYCGLAATSNGCAGVTRALRKHELPFYCNHLLRLRRQCRRSRFGNEVSDRFLRDYVGCIDLTNTAILGFFDGDEMRGAAELRSMRNVWCDAAEAAFSVDCLSQITVPQRQSQEDPGPYFAAFSGVPSNNSATLPASREP